MSTRCDDTVFRWLRADFGRKGRPINGSIDSPLEPQPAPSLHDEKFIKSANRNTVESNMPRNQQQRQIPYEGKQKLDVSDLLIECRLSGDVIWGIPRRPQLLDGRQTGSNALV